MTPSDILQILPNGSVFTDVIQAHSASLLRPVSPIESGGYVWFGDPAWFGVDPFACAVWLTLLATLALWSARLARRPEGYPKAILAWCALLLLCGVLMWATLSSSRFVVVISVFGSLVFTLVLTLFDISRSARKN
jgi:hypothetical protein